MIFVLYAGLAFRAKENQGSQNRVNEVEMPEIDILGLGAVAIDDLIFIDAYPLPDQKVPVIRRERHCGGLTATALVAAARLGAHCSYAGVLGDDELSNFGARCLEAEGIDLRFLSRRPLARPIVSTILIDQTHHTRNIFLDKQGVVGAAENWPPEEVIQSCKVLYVDNFGITGMIRAARIARKAGIPVVADIESDSELFPVLLGEIDHLILSREFARSYSGADTPAEATHFFWTPGRKIAAITCGSEGSWFLSNEYPDQPQHTPAFPVKVADTTGCGDVFHGAYAAGLVKGMDVRERIRYATGAAAIKAMTSGGQAGAPTAEALETFLKERA